MQVGDLVKYNETASNSFTSNPIMLVIETGRYDSKCDVKVVWGEGLITITKSKLLEVVKHANISNS